MNQNKLRLEPPLKKRSQRAQRSQNRKAHKGDKGRTTSQRGPDLGTWAERVEAVEGRIVISLGWNKFEGSVTV